MTCLHSCTRRPITEQALACLTHWQARRADDDAHVQEWEAHWDMRRTPQRHRTTSDVMRVLGMLAVDR